MQVRCERETLEKVVLGVNGPPIQTTSPVGGVYNTHMIFGDPVVDACDPANVASIAMTVPRHGRRGPRRSASKVDDQR